MNEITSHWDKIFEISSIQVFKDKMQPTKRRLFLKAAIINTKIEIIVSFSLSSFSFTFPLFPYLLGRLTCVRALDFQQYSFA